ncbi:polysaccharide biosynthesis/export family protein [uncultured Cytophaga sp.]|uniref:polysaccharide biosynthesis/export family protein n=1 Tax=uncultured Cytophaga sp. TaxID=160238 RepID=UPI002607C2B4|nr:polysaccharide biosynthesis/export family protein [uncultured Cytophaga sp.]
MNRYFLFFLLFCGFLSQSCLKIKKQTYFQGSISDTAAKVFNNPILSYQLRPGDVLYIKILSPEPRLSSFFNTEPEGVNVQATPNNLYIKGYLVNDTGYVALPILGTIKAMGLTLDAFKASVTEKVEQMVSTSTVIVKFASFKITVMGEVKGPGVVFFTNERVTVLEALSSAGDLTDFGKRSNIQVIRNFVDGHFEKATLDLNNINVVYNPYFYLQPNDVVYVSPNKSGVAKFNTASLTLLFASVSTILLVLNFISRN